MNKKEKEDGGRVSMRLDPKDKNDLIMDFESIKKFCLKCLKLHRAGLIMPMLESIENSEEKVLKDLKRDINNRKFFDEIDGVESPDDSIDKRIEQTKEK